MNLKMEEYAHTLNLSSDDDRLMRYLKGETIDVEDLIPAKAKGWHLVCTDGFPLGWGKVTNGTLKNKYLLDGGISLHDAHRQISCRDGQGTRSEIKKLIRSGRVMVDGETVKKPELKIDETTQKVSLDGKQIGYAKKEYYMLHKPAGVISATKDDRDKTVLDLITDKKKK